MSSSKTSVTIFAGRTELRDLVPRMVSSGLAVIAPATMTEPNDPTVAGLVVPDEISRTPDCPCCRVRVDLVDSIERAVRRASRPDRLVVVVDLDDLHGRDVAAAVYTLLSDVDLARLVHLDAVVMTYDAVALATRQAVADGGTPVLPLDDAEALALADRVLLARADDIVPKALRAVEERIQGVAPFARVVAPALQPIDADSLFSLDAWHQVPEIPAEGATSPGHPDTVVLVQHGMMDAEAIDEWFDDLVARHARRLVRFQGVVTPAGDSPRMCCFGVRSFAWSHPASDHPTSSTVENRLIVAGWSLDAAELHESFAATLL